MEFRLHGNGVGAQLRCMLREWSIPTIMMVVAVSGVAVGRSEVGPQGPQVAEMSVMSDKIGVELRHMLRKQDTDQPVEVLVRLAETPDANVLNELERAGLKIQGVSGDVITGKVMRSACDRLAAHDAVVTIEASSPLRPY